MPGCVYQLAARGVGPTRAPGSCECRPVPVGAGQEGVPLVVPIALEEVTALSSLRVYIPKDLRTPEARTLGVKVRPLLMMPLGAIVRCHLACHFRGARWTGDCSLPACQPSDLLPRPCATVLRLLRRRWARLNAALPRAFRSWTQKRT